MFLSVLTFAYTEEKLDDGSERVVLKIPPLLAPIKAAILPLTKKDGLPEKARKIMDTLKYEFNCHYEEKDTIGKRYRRHDAIGTPYCITVDHQTLEDNTVTIRERDSMAQDRINIAQIEQVLRKRIRLK
jgi:glycyl-tRNA synthetase